MLDTITIKQAPVPEKIRIAAEAGYAGVELRGNDLVEWAQGGRSVGELADLIARYRLAAPSLSTEPDVYGWHYAEPAQDPEFVEALEQYYDRCRQLGIQMLFFPVMDDVGTLDETARNYGWLCDRAAESDLVVGLEFIGHVPKVADVRTAWDVLREADRPNSGLVVDVIHFYRGGSRLKDLEQIPPEKISIVHVDDAMPLPLDQLVGSKHRLYPGEGVAPVREIVTLLEQSGYRGPYAVELFNEEYWASDPLTVARRAREATLALFGREDSV